MPHLRERQLLPLLLKRLRLWPVVGVVGARQTGKSVFLRDLIGDRIRSSYHTLDDLAERKRAERSPDSFVERDNDQELFIIDEIQKVPALFDGIKLVVDKKRVPGSYLITGSTAFSQKTGIQESLTGRIALSQLYPMNLAEKFRKPLGVHFIKDTKPKAALTPKEFDSSLSRGGMPGMCFLRSEAEFNEAVALWLETTCYRDLNQYRVGKFEGSLALDILYQVANHDEASVAIIARKLRKDARVVLRYLDALESLFVVRKLTPHPVGVGKALYMLSDAGVAGHLQANREVCLKTHVLVEALSNIEYAGSGRCKIEYFRNEKTSRIPLIVSPPKGKGAISPVAIRIVDGEAADRADFDAFTTFQNRGGTGYRKLILTQGYKGYQENGSFILPLRA